MSPEFSADLTVIPDNLSEPFWDGAQNGDLHLQRCSLCRRFQHPPSPICRTCHTDVLDFERTNGDGKIYSFTQVHQTAMPLFRALVPYYVALVELDCQVGLRILSCLDHGGREPSIGDRVETTFRDPGHGWSIPVFRPV